MPVGIEGTRRGVGHRKPGDPPTSEATKPTNAWGRCPATRPWSGDSGRHGPCPNAAGSIDRADGAGGPIGRRPRRNALEPRPSSHQSIHNPGRAFPQRSRLAVAGVEAPQERYSTRSRPELWRPKQRGPEDPRGREDLTQRRVGSKRSERDADDSLAVSLGTLDFQSARSARENPTN